MMHPSPEPIAKLTHIYLSIWKKMQRNILWIDIIPDLKLTEPAVYILNLNNTVALETVTAALLQSSNNYLVMK